MSPVSPAFVGEFFTTEPPGKPHNYIYLLLLGHNNKYIVNIKNFGKYKTQEVKILSNILMVLHFFIVDLQCCVSFRYTAK